MSDRFPNDDPHGELGPIARWWLETRVAMRFLTRVRIGDAEDDDVPLAHAARGFPIAGLVVGIVGTATYAIADTLALPAVVAAVLAVGSMILITGGLHEDGLADMADGFGGGRDREHTLAIMRDSRIGSFGVLALILVVGLRVAAITSIDGAFSAALVIVAAAAGSRAFLPAVMHYLTPARTDGLSHRAGQPEKRPVIDQAALGAAIVLAGTGLVVGVVGLAAAALVAWWIARQAQERLGGQTGDVLGAVQQATEVAILLAACAVWS